MSYEYVDAGSAQLPDQYFEAVMPLPLPYDQLSWLTATAAVVDACVCVDMPPLSSR